MAASKVPKDVDAYIESAAGSARPMLEELRKIIKSTLPKVEEGISYGVPFYKYHGAVGGFVAYKSHVTFGLGADVLEIDDRDRLEQSGYKVLKGTMQIKFDQKVPRPAIQRMLKAKAKLNEAEARA